MHIRGLTGDSKTLSAELHALAEEFKLHPVTVDEVIRVLQERA